MIKQAFTLMELLVGMLVSMILLGAMATFLGDASYTFQEHKAVLTDRSQLQQAMMSISRDLMFVGQSADDDGVFEYEGLDTWFLSIENDGDASLGTSLTYYRVYESMDYAASADDGKAYTWFPVTFAVDKNAKDPITKESMNILTRNGEPFLLGVTEFSLAFGIDSDSDGTIADGEWVTDVPADDATKNTVIGGATQIRLTLGRQTLTADGQTLENTLVRDIKLRNRN